MYKLNILMGVLLIVAVMARCSVVVSAGKRESDGRREYEME